MVSQARQLGTFLLCRHSGTLLCIPFAPSQVAVKYGLSSGLKPLNSPYFTATAEEDRADGGVAKRAPSLISYLVSVDVYAGD